MKYVKTFSLLLVFALLFSVSLIVTTGGVTFGNDTVEVRIDIISADYTDADDDGLEDDIVSDFSIVSEFNDDDKELKMLLIFNLELPSVTNYEYKFIVTISEGIQKYRITYLDHATEPGWYTETITGILKMTRDKTIRGTTSLVFDPPGGGEGGVYPPTLEEI